MYVCLIVNLDHEYSSEYKGTKSLIIYQTDISPLFNQKNEEKETTRKIEYR
jgi:hypothetical protein